MAKSTPSLSDKFDLDLTHQLLTGTQAVVRLTLMQHMRDKVAGLNTAGYVTGYRGSPIASLEGAFQRAEGICKQHNVLFQSGLNEDLAATALWGSQMSELRGEGKFDGVFGVWYGKGPGVDRTGDVFRHANHAGTSKHGGVIALLGDDHTCESSTSAHQSEFAMVDFMIPVLNPAGVQEILDYGVHGFAMSRFAGVWVGIKCVKDNIESTSVVDGRIDRVQVKLPDDFVMPPDGLNIRQQDQAPLKEARLHDYKRDAVIAYARVNKLDKMITSGGANAKVGIITTGKSYLDVRSALEELGIDEVKANALGLRLYKVAMPYPIETQGLEKFAEGLDLIIVVEEKRSLIEVQVKEELYNSAVRNPSIHAYVIGKKDEHGNALFPAKGALEPTDIAVAVGERLIRCGAGEEIKERVSALKGLKGNKPDLPEVATRLPYFCPGCPHNSSTVVPEGAHAYAGIGCHYMAQWMGRSTEGFTQMGGEGANWIGEAPFSKREHVFQNLGDGTYLHSGSLAVRAAIVSGVNVTYKILYNDAVAMTGGQKLDGQLTVPMVVNQMLAEGARRVVIVTDEPDKYPSDSGIPSTVTIHHRRDLQAVQIELSKVKGVTVLVYDQTCAAEKRRRRKRGLFPDPDKRAFINPAVCEGCGDCSKKSNCVAVSPLETALGTKRMIDQSACNKDFSCINGFCPSFVTVHGARMKTVSKPKAADADPLAPAFAALPVPKQPTLDLPYAMIVTGVGGTGVVTISAVLGEAAYLDGKGFGAIDMTGLAQKGGAVACHMRFAKTADDIHAIRTGVGGADLILGCDLVVTGSNKVLETVKPDQTAVVYSTHEMNVATFTLNPNYKLPGGALVRSIEDRVRKGPLFAVDAQRYAEKLFGDTIASNMFMLGYAVQLGFVPVGIAAIEQAIGLNGVAVAMNKRAFNVGRLAAHDLAAVEKLMPVEHKAVRAVETLDDIIASRTRLLTDYQDAAYAARYEATVRRLGDVERQNASGRSGFAEAVAKGLYKLMAYKDEYEVGRLYSSPQFMDALAEQFDSHGKLEFHLAPPLLARHDPLTGEPRKMTFGPWMMKAFGWLGRMKHLRGGTFDVFGYTAERKLERQMIGDYEALMAEVAGLLKPETHTTAVQLALLPLEIKGFGHVKKRAYDAAKVREAQLMTQMRNPSPRPVLRAAE
ncbi:MAG: indolepyruvate ferredoxin oxidoreductase family protein [Hyphomicrobiaceae bacterium]